MGDYDCNFMLGMHKNENECEDALAKTETVCKEDSAGVIDLTNDDTEIPCSVQFSWKRKYKKKNDKKSKKVNKGVDTEDIISLKIKGNVAEERKVSSLSEQHITSASLSSRPHRQRKEVNYKELCDNVFTCTHCNESYESFEELNDHVSTHDEDSSNLSFLCPHKECERKCLTQHGLQLHMMRVHDMKKTHLCLCCHKSFNTKKTLNKHYCKLEKAKNAKTSHQSVSEQADNSESFEEEKMFTCCRCKKKFFTALDLSKHQLIHTMGRKFKCDSCGAALLSEIALVNHKKLHTSGKNKQILCQLICPEPDCKLQIQNLTVYKYHVRSHFLGETKYPCPQCGTHFSEWSNMLRHLKIHLDIKDKKCTQCEKVFRDSVSLVSHMRRSHTGYRPHKCDQCPKAFHMKSDLNRHKTVHSDFRKYTCTDCGKKFKSQCALTAHLKLKSGEKPWQCGVCNRKFPSKGGLETHMMTHSHLKRYECETCQRQFTYRQSLTAHIRSHTGVMPYTCQFCGKKFSHGSNMRRHEKTVHG